MPRVLTPEGLEALGYTGRRGLHTYDVDARLLPVGFGNLDVIHREAPHSEGLSDRCDGWAYVADWSGFWGDGIAYLKVATPPLFGSAERRLGGEAIAQVHGTMMSETGGGLIRRYILDNARDPQDDLLKITVDDVHAVAMDALKLLGKIADKHAESRWRYNKSVAL